MDVKDHRPVYIQIAETLRARIVSGYYTDKIDGELRLAAEWKVSRRTIQQALETLVGEGLLIRQHGMGTFINPKGVEKRYHAITSITEGIAGQGMTPSFVVLDSDLYAPTPEEAEFFRLDDGDDLVYRHKRLVSAEGRPIAIASTSLNIKYLKGLELSDLAGSLYGSLRSQFGRTIVSAEDKYLPAVADDEVAELLNLPKGEAIFIAIRKAMDQTGSPIELSYLHLLPVPLDISIRNVGFSSAAPLAREDREWSYTVGFGDFHKL